MTHFHGEESRREAAAAAPAFCGSGGAAGSFLRTAEPSQSRLRRASSPKGGGAFGDAVKFPVLTERVKLLLRGKTSPGRGKMAKPERGTAGERSEPERVGVLSAKPSGFD